MKKVLALALALTMVLAVLTGCGGSPSPSPSAQAPAATQAPAEQKPSEASTAPEQPTQSEAPAATDEVIHIGFASNANDENMNMQMKCFQEYCDNWNAEGKTPKVEAHITVADASVEKQLADVESLIELECKSIYLHSVDLEGMKPAVDACNAAGVLVLEARGMDYDKIDVHYRGANEVMMAEMAFEWYKAQMDANPNLNLKMGLIYGLAAQSQQLVRVDHLVELLKEAYPDRVEVVDSMPCDWDAQKAMECMENWLQKYSGGKMNCVVAAGAMMCMGAAQAAVSAGESMDDWLFTTTDATSDVLYGIHEGVADMTVGIRADQDGYAAAKTCIEMALGQFQGNEFQIGPEILATIDSTNIDEWYKGQ